MDGLRPHHSPPAWGLWAPLSLACSCVICRSANFASKCALDHWAVLWTQHHRQSGSLPALVNLRNVEHMLSCMTGELGTHYGTSSARRKVVAAVPGGQLRRTRSCKTDETKRNETKHAFMQTVKLNPAQNSHLLCQYFTRHPPVRTATGPEQSGHVFVRNSPETSEKWCPGFAVKRKIVFCCRDNIPTSAKTSK